MKKTENTSASTTTIELKSFVSLRDGLDLARLVQLHDNIICEMDDRLDNDDTDGATDCANLAGMIEVQYLALAKNMLAAERAGRILYGYGTKAEAAASWSDLREAIIATLCDEITGDASKLDEDTIEKMTNYLHASGVKVADLGNCNLTASYYDHLPHSACKTVGDLVKKVDAKYEPPAKQVVISYLLEFVPYNDYCWIAGLTIDEFFDLAHRDAEDIIAEELYDNWGGAIPRSND